jgi:hypothetical protein
MGTLKTEAENYEPPQTLNIADLPKVPIEVTLYEKESKNAEGETFKYKYATINGKDYRVPNTVLEEIKKMLKLKPTIQFVHVKKSGSGLGTRYEVEEAF